MQGEDLALISGDVLLRREAYTGRVRDYSMVVRRPGMHFEITLSEVKRSIRLPLDERDMSREVDPVLAGFTLGGFALGESFYPVLDLDKLITDGELVDAAIAPDESSEGLGDE